MNGNETTNDCQKKLSEAFERGRQKGFFEGLQVVGTANIQYPLGNFMAANCVLHAANSFPRSIITLAPMERDSKKYPIPTAEDVRRLNEETERLEKSRKERAILDAERARDERNRKLMIYIPAAVCVISSLLLLFSLWGWL